MGKEWETASYSLTVRAEWTCINYTYKPSVQLACRKNFSFLVGMNTGPTVAVVEGFLSGIHIKCAYLWCGFKYSVTFLSFSPKPIPSKLVVGCFLLGFSSWLYFAILVLWCFFVCWQTIAVCYLPKIKSNNDNSNFTLFFLRRVLFFQINHIIHQN